MNGSTLRDSCKEIALIYSTAVIISNPENIEAREGQRIQTAVVSDKARAKDS
jgi:hypothetical protein